MCPKEQNLARLAPVTSQPENCKPQKSPVTFNTHGVHSGWEMTPRAQELSSLFLRRQSTLHFLL